jgi:hypothetical protein
MFWQNMRIPKKREFRKSVPGSIYLDYLDRRCLRYQSPMAKKFCNIRYFNRLSSFVIGRHDGYVSSVAQSESSGAESRQYW